jgi:hypothetical protein
MGAASPPNATNFVDPGLWRRMRRAIFDNLLQNPEINYRFSGLPKAAAARHLPWGRQAAGADPARYAKALA